MQYYVILIHHAVIWYNLRRRTWTRNVSEENESQSACEIAVFKSVLLGSILPSIKHDSLKIKYYPIAINILRWKDRKRRKHTESAENQQSQPTLWQVLRNKPHIFTIDLDLSMIAVYVFIVPQVICVYLSIISVVLFLGGLRWQTTFLLMESTCQT